MSSTRQEVFDKKATLQRTLRQRCANGTLTVGDLAPSVRQIAREFGVSQSVATRAMQELIGDGLFHTIARSGTFVGTAPRTGRSRFLFLTKVLQNSTTTLVRIGFENRIAELGGSVMASEIPDIESLVANDGAGAERLDSFFPLSGVMEWGQWFPDSMWQRQTLAARVRYATTPSEAIDVDGVTFDDIDGGRQASQHLLTRGYRRIAFLGLHHVEDDGRVEGPSWSLLREHGWRECLDKAGLYDARLSLHASRPVDPYSVVDQTKAAEELTHLFCTQLRHLGAEAVVTANDLVARALVENLRKSGAAPGAWPAIVSFDNDPAVSDEIITSLRLPWNEIGETAASLVWERAQGTLPEEAQHRFVKMRLIPRLSCRGTGAESPWKFASAHL